MLAAWARSRAFGLLLATIVCVAVLAFRGWQNRDVFYDRFNLPAFDGHVYAAMAEEPRVFTIAPWGYRLLTPWLVHVLPGNAVLGFAQVTPAALLMAGLAAFALLHRLGHGNALSAIAAAALLASDPVARILRYSLLVEPLTLLLETLFLLGLATGASWPVLALVGVLGTASKEFFVLLLPAVFLARLPDGWKRAALETAGVMAPSLAFTLILRSWWTPYLASPVTGFPPLGERVHVWATTQLGSAVLLGLLVALAAHGALHVRRRWHSAFAWVAGVAFAAPFLNPSDFSAPDLPRLHVYVLPALLPFVLLSLERVWPHASEPAPVTPGWPVVQVASLVAAAAIVGAPFALLDRYQRVDLRGDGDPARVLATCRGTLTTAQRLARGEEILLLPLRAAAENPGEPGLRWFLRHGWEAGDGVAVLRADRGSLILPVRPPRALRVGLAFAPGTASNLRFSMAGRPLEPREFEGINLLIPADRLVRGDNLLVIERGPEGPPPQLRGLLLHHLP